MHTRADTLTDAHFRLIGQVVQRHCGINLADGKHDMVGSRILRRVTLGGYASISDYLDRVLADPASTEFHAMIDALTTNLTHFFREPTHFAYLSQTLIPAAVQRQEGHVVARIRGWSAGCSTGEEPYTLAIVLREALGERGLHDAKLLATDISSRVLATAVAGVYRPETVDAVRPDLRAKYFIPTGGRDNPAFKVAPEIVSMVRFRKLNLMDRFPFTGTFDFIFCRNVMIYFDKATQSRLVDRFWQCLEPGGVLFTGHSESLMGFDHRFDYVQPTIYMKPAEAPPATSETDPAAPIETSAA